MKIKREIFKRAQYFKMETIENFRQAIINLYSTMDRGLTENDNNLLNILENSPSSLQFAIQEISSGDCINFHILLESTIIITNFVRNSWSSFSQDYKVLIIKSLLNCIMNVNEKNAIFNKAIACIADIIALEFKLFYEIFPKLPSHIQLDLIIILIEEMGERQIIISGNDVMYSKYLIELCPWVLQMLSDLPLSIEFLNLSKAALSCFVTYDQYSPFMDKFDEAINEPKYFPYCANFVRTILINASPYQDKSNDDFFFRIMKFSIMLASEFAKQRIFDVPCEIWTEVASFNNEYFKDTNFSKFFLSELIKFLQVIPILTPELEELFEKVCFVLADSDIPTYTEELIQLFHFLLSLTDNSWSYALDDAIFNISHKIPDAVAQILIEKIQNPTPGLFIACCQCNKLPNEYFPVLCACAIELKDSLPVFHLLTFIKKIGFKYPEFYDQWLSILIQLFPFQPNMCINNLANLLTIAEKKGIDLTSKIPQELYIGIIQYFDSLEKPSKNICPYSICIFNAICIFNTSLHSIPIQFLEKIYIFVMNLTEEMIMEEYFKDICHLSEYFNFIGELNNKLGYEQYMLEFKKKILDSLFEMVKRLSSSFEEDQQKFMTYFLQELSKLITFSAVND